MDRLLKFEGLNENTSKWTYRKLGKRCPNAGEFYVSGAIPQAYKARQHLTMDQYLVVEPLTEYVEEKVWVPKRRD